jgi:hypothetical protein
MPSCYATSPGGPTPPLHPANPLSSVCPPPKKNCCRHELSLYAHISKVTWQFDREDEVIGTVSDPASGDIRRFDLDPKTMSDFEVVNKLWEVIDASANEHFPPVRVTTSSAST